MTHLNAARLAGNTGSTSESRPAGPAVPTAGAMTAHRPLTGAGAELTGGLLYDWQRRNRKASLPLALRQLEAAGNLDNLRLAAEGAGAPGRRADGIPAADSVHPASAAEGADAAQAIDAGGEADGRRYQGPVFMDSDVYKTLEAVAWELGRPGQQGAGGPGREELTRFADQTIALLERAQQDDGYLNSYFQVSGEPRYSRLAWSHEMYCAGHLIQAAVALNRSVPGSGLAGRLLAVARRLADHLAATFGGRERGLDGHPEIETALAELYRETGHRPYLDLAAQFIGQRGHGLAGDSGRGRRYLQDWRPARDTVTLEGHAVRALYLEAGLTDVAAETGDTALLASSLTRWADMTAAKTALTGGTGSRHADEAFGDHYELPPDRAYNETCAAIAALHWSWRLLLATGHARYADLAERLLYNAFGAAVSAGGQRFFYVNPLQRRPGHTEGDDPGRRHQWFSCACCPPNIMRLLASLHHYLATTSGDTLYLHQYTSARLTAALAPGPLALTVTTGYPWHGQITLTITTAPAQPCGLALRIPPWSPAPPLTLNGQPAQATPDGHGYQILTRTWHPGDQLTLTLDLTPRPVYPHPRIDALRGCVAIQRGPLVYCFEQTDQPDGTDVDQIAVPGVPALRERQATLPGIGPTILVETQAATIPGTQPDGLPYTPAPAPAPAGPALTATAIPYFQWDNRDGRAMRVWLPRA